MCQSEMTGCIKHSVCFSTIQAFTRNTIRELEIVLNNFENGNLVNDGFLLSFIGTMQKVIVALHLSLKYHELNTACIESTSLIYSTVLLNSVSWIYYIAN